jgi:hypothetical protein
VANLLVQRTAPGVALVSTTDPFDTLAVHRIDRASWQQTPQLAGVYLLYGFPNGEPTAYIGMSEADMRQRVRTHHVTPQKNWFGVLFAVPLQSPVLCRAVEAELIQQASEANVVQLTNEAAESRFAGLDDVQVEPAVEKISAALEILLGTDIFTSQDLEEPESVGPALEQFPRYARTGRGAAENPRPRRPDDPPEATHAYVSPAIPAWGRFEADEPDTRFRVLTGSAWRWTTVDPSQANFAAQGRLRDRQQELVAAGVLDPEGMRFTKDHVFDNWGRAVVIVAGKPNYSGGRNWQALEPEGP